MYNAEAHADMFIHTSPLSMQNTHGYNRGLYKTHPQGIYRCFVFDSD